MHTFHKKSEILQRWLDFTTNFWRFSRYNGFSQILQKSWFRSFVWKLKLKLKLYNGNTTFWESHLNIHTFHDEFFGLISESFSIFLKSPKQGAKSLAWALYTWREDGPSFAKGGHKEHAVYHVRERRFISPWCKHPIEHHLSISNAQCSQAMPICDWLKVLKANGSPVLPKNLQFRRVICKTV